WDGGPAPTDLGALPRTLTPLYIVCLNFGNSLMHLRWNEPGFAAQASPQPRHKKIRALENRALCPAQRQRGAVVGSPGARGENRPLAAASKTRSSVRAAGSGRLGRSRALSGHIRTRSLRRGTDAC